jgi:hypothetical protein
MSAPTQPLVEPATSTGEIRLFSLHVDFPASVHVRWLTGKIIELAGPHWKTSSETWKIDALKASDGIRKMLTSDAINADVVIVAFSLLAQPEPALIQWLNALGAEHISRPTPGVLIALLGNEDSKAQELDEVVKPLMVCSQQLGRDFIWQWMGEIRTLDGAWVTGNINTLLARKIRFSQLRETNPQ